MAEIVNLRQARKARKRAQDQQAAAENRARFGETKELRTLRLREAERLDHQVDQARRDPAG